MWRKWSLGLLFEVRLEQQGRHDYGLSDFHVWLCRFSIERREERWCASLYCTRRRREVVGGVKGPGGSDSGRRNEEALVWCLGLQRKMGIRSSTCASMREMRELHEMRVRTKS